MNPTPACVLLPVVLCLGISSSLRADFTQVDSSDLTGIWLTRGDGQWHTSFGQGWSLIDDDFGFLSSVSTGLSGARGIEYDAFNDRMLLMDHDRREIRIYNLDGTLLSTIDDALNGNDVSVDPRDGSIWQAVFGGAIRHYSSDGVLLDSFDAGFFLSGIELDPLNNTLLVLRAEGPGGANGPLDDELYEFTTSGENLGRLWDSSVIAGNGLALEYLPELGRLYVTSQTPSGFVTVFEDLSRVVPEPASGMALTMAAFIMLGRCRRRAA